MRQCRHDGAVEEGTVVILRELLKDPISMFGLGAACGLTFCLILLLMKRFLRHRRLERLRREADPLKLGVGEHPAIEEFRKGIDDYEQKLLKEDWRRDGELLIMKRKAP